MNKYADSYYNPIGMRFSDWANKVKIIYEKEIIPFPPHEDHWHLWGAFLTKNVKFFHIPIPSRTLYKSWQPWAMDFVNYLVTSDL